MKKIKSIKDGPYKAEGPVAIEDGQGSIKEFKQGEDAWLCRCGNSKNKPYCDGSHKKVGFKSEK